MGGTFLLSILDRPMQFCDGFTRREWLRIGGLSALGLSLPTAFHSDVRAKESHPSMAAGFGSARSCILSFPRRRPSAARNLRSQTECSRRTTRTVPTDRHECARCPIL